MKMPKIQRPEIEVEYVGVKGLFLVLIAICRVGIRKMHIDCTIKSFTPKIHGIEGGTVKRYYFYVIPKYKFQRVSKLSEDEEK